MDNQALNEFKRQFGFLTKFGLKIHGITNLIADHNVISISTPFIFDHRAIPKKFMGLDIRNSTPKNEIPLEFQMDNDREYIWAYQRFEEFVDNNTELIRITLDNPNLTRDEMLDALCFGDFNKHKEMCIKWENTGKIPKWNSSR